MAIGFSFITIFAIIYSLPKMGKTVKMPIIIILYTICNAISSFLLTYSYLFFDDFTQRFNYIFSVLSVFCAIIWCEQIRNEKPNAMLMMVFGILGGFAIVSSLLPNTIDVIYIGNNPVMQWGGLWQVFGLLFQWVGIAYIASFFIYMASQSPRYLKLPLLFYIITFVIAFLIMDIIEQFVSNNAIALSTPQIIMAYIIYGLLEMAGGFYWLWLILKYPEFLTILTYKVNRLIVIKNDSGIPLLDFQWKPDQIDESLISGLIQAIQNMGMEVLKMGSIRQIHLDSGVLLLYRGKYITSGIISTKISHYLHEKIQLFTEKFESQFNSELSGSCAEVSIFDKGKVLIQNLIKGC